jgi:hypothetical protein|tara:strand:- start:136 stop:534 length:399 start_codon:yes stop_codon:yes gene_type:complete
MFFDFKERRKIELTKQLIQTENFLDEFYKNLKVHVPIEKDKNLHGEVKVEVEVLFIRYEDLLKDIYRNGNTQENLEELKEINFRCKYFFSLFVDDKVGHETYEVFDETYSNKYLVKEKFIECSKNGLFRRFK